MKSLYTREQGQLLLVQQKALSEVGIGERLYCPGPACPNAPPEGAALWRHACLALTWGGPWPSHAQPPLAATIHNCSLLGQHLPL